MIHVSSIDIVFHFSNGSEKYTRKESFVAADSSLQTTVDDRIKELLDEGDGDWIFDEFVIDDYDGDYKDPNEFDDLDDYGVYCERIEEHGEAYALRYEDIGDNFNFEDQYEGCWADDKEFAEHVIEVHYRVDLPCFVHIDWESTARDLMMDYSAYDGNDGTHIFRD